MQNSPRITILAALIILAGCGADESSSGAVADDAVTEETTEETTAPLEPRAQPVVFYVTTMTPLLIRRRHLLTPVFLSGLARIRHANSVPTVFQIMTWVRSQIPTIQTP
jgi:hypothetical protein